METITVNTIREFLYMQNQHISHIAVGHTFFRPYEKSNQQIAKYVEIAHKQCRFFRNRFNQFLYGAKAHRKPLLYQPLLITTIEGTNDINDRSQTIHFNFALGNIPDELTTEELRQVFTDCWIRAGLNDKALWLREAGSLNDNQGWLKYITKEAETGNLETWDFENTQIPYLALTTD